jgi:hypothetical protein
MSCSGAAFAADGDANEALLKKLEKMERRIQLLEAELKQKQSQFRVCAAGSAGSRAL